MELKSNELRIGNFIIGTYENEDNNLVHETVCEFKFYNCYDDFYFVESLDLIEDFTGFKPIPITEEWLLKFGFAKQCDYLYFDFENGNISFNDEIKNGISLCIGTYCSSGSAFENIKHVHQLQNLFFALTGEELKLIH